MKTNTFEKKMILVGSLMFLFSISPNLFAFSVKPLYPTLPQYGFVEFNSASCAVSAETGGVTWSATPSGFGYPAVQYQCSGSYTVRIITGTNAGTTCLGTFSAISTPPPNMFTDAAGSLNPDQSADSFFLNNTNNDCSGFIIGAAATVSVFMACNLSIGGGLDVILTGTAASCNVI